MMTTAVVVCCCSCGGSRGGWNVFPDVPEILIQFPQMDPVELISDDKFAPETHIRHKSIIMAFKANQLKGPNRLPAWGSTFGWLEISIEGLRFLKVCPQSQVSPILLTVVLFSRTHTRKWVVFQSVTSNPYCDRINFLFNPMMDNFLHLNRVP